MAWSGSAYCVPGMLELIRAGEASGFDGYVVACFRDPGLEAEVLYVAVDLAAAHDTAERIDALVPAMRGAIERAGSSPPMRRRLALTEFYAAMKNRRMPEAKAACDRATELALPEEHARVAANCSCRIAIASRDPKTVVSSCEAALTETRTHFGENHPLTADAINNTIVALQRDSKNDQARERIDEAWAIEDKILPPVHPQRARALYVTGVLKKTMGKVAEGREMLERALAMRIELTGEEHPDVVETLGELAKLEAAPRIWRSTSRCTNDRPDFARR